VQYRVLCILSTTYHLLYQVTSVPGHYPGCLACTPYLSEPECRAGGKPSAPFMPPCFSPPHFTYMQGLALPYSALLCLSPPWCLTRPYRLSILFGRRVSCCCLYVQEVSRVGTVPVLSPCTFPSHLWSPYARDRMATNPCSQAFEISSWVGPSAASPLPLLTTSPSLTARPIPVLRCDGCTEYALLLCTDLHHPLPSIACGGNEDRHWPPLSLPPSYTDPINGHLGDRHAALVSEQLHVPHRCVAGCSGPNSILPSGNGTWRSVQHYIQSMVSLCTSMTKNTNSTWTCLAEMAILPNSMLGRRPGGL
jgi:hypothetical protein